MIAVNKVKRGFYADSVALMRIAQTLQKDGSVASLMIGTPSNKALLKQFGLLSKEGAKARPDDLIIAVKGRNAEDALVLAEKLLNLPKGNDELKSSNSLDSAVQFLSGANLALISVPGDFAHRARERERVARAAGADEAHHRGRARHGEGAQADGFHDRRVAHVRIGVFLAVAREIQPLGHFHWRREPLVARA